MKDVSAQPRSINSCMDFLEYPALRKMGAERWAK
jgi:hypothetical protein